MFYCDTSLLLAALTDEPHTEVASMWLADQCEGELATSDWLTTELASGVARKLQRGELSRADMLRIRGVWHSTRDQSFTMLPVRSTDFARASALIADLATPLRAGDALHLAVAATHNLSVATLDKVMATAADELGLPVATLLARH